MQRIAMPESAFIGPGEHATPTAVGTNTEGAHPLSVPVAPMANQTPATEQGPSTTPTQYDYTYRPKG